MRVIGLDPSLRNMGYAVLRLERDGRQVVEEVGVLSTAPNNKTRHLRKADDLSDRTRYIYREIAKVIQPSAEMERGMLAIGVESTAFGPSAAKLARVRGVVDGLAERFDLPIIEETAQALKKLITGSTVATKEEMQAALEARFPGVVALWPSVESKIEHASDALSAAVAAAESDHVRIALKLRRLGS